MTSLLVTAFSLLVLAVPDDGTNAARAAAKEARVAFDAGDFTAALKKYEEAFRLKPVPALQFNLGQCHRHLGNTERALYFLRRFLESNPPEPQAAQVRPIITELEAKLTDEERARSVKEEHARALELEHAKATAAQAQAEAAARAAEEAKFRAELEEAIKRPPTAMDSEPLYKKSWFWVAVVGGAAAIATGVGVSVYVGTSPRPTPTTFPDINAR